MSHRITAATCVELAPEYTLGVLFSARPLSLPLLGNLVGGGALFTVSWMHNNINALASGNGVAQYGCRKAPLSFRIFERRAAHA